MFSIQQKIENQKNIEQKKEKPVRALKTPVDARSHTNVYKMHRYYARRPWNLFEHIIKHYSEAGEIILDPFCGGGVTVVEGLKLRRKVIGVDLNPLAVFVTKTEVESLNIDVFSKAFYDVEKVAKEKIITLYQTKCRNPKCHCKKAIVQWYEWSNVFACPECKTKNVIDEIRKKSAGKYICRQCEAIFRPSQSEKVGEKLVRLLVECEKCSHSEICKPTSEDVGLSEKISNELDKIIKKEKLWYPQDKFPDGDRQRDDALFQKGITHFYKMFTSRNLLANARLFKVIQDYDCDEDIKEFLYLCFSDSLRFSNRMMARNPNWRGGNPEWGGHAFWIPDRFCEVNPYQAFTKRMKSILKGKEESNEQIGDYYQHAEKYHDLNNDKTCLLLNRSSHDLPLPHNSVDCVITDPPFGGNVQYAELADFWVIWLRNILGTNGVIDTTFEAISTRHKGFETEKSLEHYEEMLYKIFKECHRVLKPDGWMVMTFHNRDVNVWMALHRAANRAGFKLPPSKESDIRGMLYQPAVKIYTHTFHQRATGSMHGDFVLSFKRMDIMEDFHKIRDNLSQEQERFLVNRITDLIQYHAGADDNTIMTGLIPALNEFNILHQVAFFDWEVFLSAHFKKDKKSKRWYTKAMYQQYYDEEKKRIRPIDYIPAEQITKNLLMGYLKEQKYATTDELLKVVYMQLVNGQRPGIEAIKSFIVSYCEEIELWTNKKKKGYRLKTKKEIEKPKEVEPVIQQIGIFVS